MAVVKLALAVPNTAADTVDIVVTKPPAIVIVNLTESFTGTLAESVAVTAKVYVPAVLAAGVPEIAPVDAFNNRPEGNSPEVTAKRYGDVPCVATTRLLVDNHAVPTVPVKVVGATTFSFGATQTTTPA